uniref:Uncharacterized protein n=1 Tax=Mycena chlorophos TaxID=658473 RepID=A0ABQ0M0W6_MYCCL|nr:predicted protein [Mycena chlorophos]
MQQTQKTKGETKACKRLNAIGSSKPVWDALVARLLSRGLLDASFISGPDNGLAGLSQAELVDCVKRAVHGPVSWRPVGTEDTFEPRVTRSLVVHTHPSGDNTPIFDVKAVPDGRHLLVHSGHTLECWDMQTGTKIWNSPQSATLWRLGDFAFEQQEVGTLNFEVFELDIRGAAVAARQLCWFEIQHVPWTVKIASFCGSLIAFTFNEAYSRMFLVDWRGSAGIVLFLNDSYKQREVALTQEFLVLALTRDSGSIQLRVVNLASEIIQRMVPIHQRTMLTREVPDYGVSVLDPAVPTQKVARGRPDGSDVIMQRLAVFPSVLSDEAHRIWLVIVELEPLGVVPSASKLHGFSLSSTSKSTGMKPQLGVLGVKTTLPPRHSNLASSNWMVTSSGHQCIRTQTMPDAPGACCILHPEGATGTFNFLPRGRPIMSSTASSACIHVEDETITVLYFD